MQVKSLLQKDPLHKLKQVLFFVAEVEGTVRLQNEEIIGRQWFHLSEAIQKIAHSEGKVSLNKCNRSFRI